MPGAEPTVRVWTITIENLNIVDVCPKSGDYAAGPCQDGNIAAPGRS